MIARSIVASLALVVATSAAQAQTFTPADSTQRPSGSGTQVLPEKMLRGYDPITAYFDRDVGPFAGPEDQGAKHLKIEPAFPGAWTWIDKRTLQFRPSEPWPALARFAATAGGKSRVLTTLMQPPDELRPAPESTGLAPFRSISLRFPAPLSVDSLRRMLSFEVREQPGLADSPRRTIREVQIAQAPRTSHTAPAEYVVTFPEPIPEGRVLVVTAALALGETDRQLWTARISTRESFRLKRVQCGSAGVDLLGGRSAPKDAALACGNDGRAPILHFSADPKNVTLSQVKQLVRLDPAVPDLDFSVNGTRLELRGSFAPDVLYRLTLADVRMVDGASRPLDAVPATELFFYLGWKSPYLRWDATTPTLEVNGPRMVPMNGYGDARTDVRIHRIDALNLGLWPFPRSPVRITEQSAPPFPGEEPSLAKDPVRGGSAPVMESIRLLGSPLVSRIVELPKGAHTKGGRFGLDIGPLLDDAVGAKKPGTYLVGFRRLTGPAQRDWIRVQVTNLSVTTVAERDGIQLLVRTLDTAAPVTNALVKIEGLKLEGTSPRERQVPAQWEARTDASGRVTIPHLSRWISIARVHVASGDDLLVFDPSEPPPQFVSGRWDLGGTWLDKLLQPVSEPANDALLAFLFSERPVYRPGDTVHLKAFARWRRTGKLLAPGNASEFALEVTGPDGTTRPLETTTSALSGFTADFKDEEAPTGEWTARLVRRKPREVLVERTFKVEEYRLPTFEVQLSAPNVTRLDAPFKVKAVARYYAGGNVAGARIRWEVTPRPTWHVPAGREGFLFASSSQFERPQQAVASRRTSSTATLGEDGSAELTIDPSIDPDGTPRIYRVEATVVGPDDQEVATRQEIRALPPFTLGMKLERLLKEAKELKPQLVAIGVDDKPVVGQAVTVRLFRRIWHSHLRETNFASGEAKYVTEREDRKIAEKQVTTTKDPLTVPFPVTEAGVYVVSLEARDRLGRVQTLEADLYVAGDGAMAWKKPRDGIFAVTADKPKFRAGDTAKLVLQSPFQDAWALVVVERPEKNEYQWIRVSGGKATADVRVDAANVPNLPVHVLLMRGRVGEGTGDDTRFRPQSVASSIQLEVEPVTNQVQMSLEIPESARPATKIDVGVKLRDEKGRPLSGEVTLWLVDEAVLALGKEGPLDPLESMVPRNQSTTAIRDSRNTVVGRLLGLDELPGGDGGEEEADLLRGKLMVRRNFQSVPFWQATIEVPASGEIRVPVQLADDLTNFAVRAVAVSGLERFGFAQKRLKVRLPVLVQPVAPRFVRSGDRLLAGALARVVEGPGGPAAVQFEIQGPARSPGVKQAITLDATAPNRIEAPIEVGAASPREKAQLVLRAAVRRNSDGAGDAVEVKLPVLTDRPVERFAKAIRLQPGSVSLPGFPETPRPGSGELTLSATTIPGLLSVASGLEALEANPHQSLLTKLARILPGLEQGAFLRRLGFAAYAETAQKHARMLATDLHLYQDESGLFGDWPGTGGSELNTQWAVDFMVAAKRAGITIDPKVESRALEGLRRVLRSDWGGFYADWRDHQRVAALRGLALAGQIDQGYALELFAMRDRLDAESAADLSEALLKDQRAFADQVKSLRSDLWDRVIFQLHDGKPRFTGIKWGRARWWDGYLSTETSTVASMLDALVQLTPADPRLLLVRDALAARADPISGFGGSFANRRAVAAFGTWLDAAQVDVPRASLVLGDVGNLTLEKGKELQLLQTTGAKPLAGTLTGAPVDTRLSGSYLPAESGALAKARVDGFVVSRTMTLHRPDAPPQTFADEPGATRTLKVGDVVEIHARIETPVERYYASLAVPFAAAFEPMNPELETAPPEARPSETDSLRPTYVQRGDDEIRYVFTRLPAGTHAFHFRLKVTSRGEFTHPPASAEQIYIPGPFGRSAGLKVVVSE